jgi:50S ribosomal protein L16 3-hydroxylase
MSFKAELDDYQKKYKEFWRGYRRKAWKHKPTLIKDPFSGPIVSSDEIFCGILNAGFSGQNLTFELDYPLSRDGLTNLFPERSDESFVNYYERIRKNLGERKFCITGSMFNADLGWRVSDRLRLFLQEMYQVTGVPIDGAEAVLFAGNYDLSPKGIHQDSADVFHLIIEGVKRVRLWPQRRFSSTTVFSEQLKEDYEELKKGSILLEGKAGDILYWPSSYWHVGEATGSLTSSLSIGVHFGDGLPKLLKSFLFKYPPEIKMPVNRTMALDLNKTSDYIRAVKKSMSQKWFDEMIERYRMELTSNSGFLAAPKLNDPTSLKLDSQICVPGQFPILYKKIGKRLCVASGGNSVLIPYEQSVVKLLKKLNSGVELEVQELIDQFESNEMDHGFVFEFLKLLRKWNGIRMVEGS